MIHDIEDPRREFLIKALGLGLFATTSGVISPVYALGDIAAKLPPGRSIYKLKGSVQVDGKPATIETKVSANSWIRTGKSSRIIFVVGSDAFILRENSELRMNGKDLLIGGMRILTGKLLSVFGKRSQQHQIQTTTATIGIRGTGIYVESEQERSYVCTCYGQTIITANNDPNSHVEVTSSHHDAPFYIMQHAAENHKIIRPAPVINHTDTELELIEQLVGRTTPFDNFDFTGDGGFGSY